MPPKCSICSHERRTEIDAALVSGTPLRDIAQQFDVSISALSRHRKNGHIGKAAVKALKAREIADAEMEIYHGSNVVKQLDDLLDTGRRLLSSAEAQDDLRAAAPLLGQVRQTLESIAKISGELQGDGPTVNIAIVENQYNDLRSIVQEVMCPECRRRLAEHLKARPR